MYVTFRSWLRRSSHPFEQHVRDFYGSTFDSTLRRYFLRCWLGKDTSYAACATLRNPSQAFGATIAGFSSTGAPVSRFFSCLPSTAEYASRVARLSCTPFWSSLLVLSSWYGSSSASLTSQPFTCGPADSRSGQVRQLYYHCHPQKRLCALCRDPKLSILTFVFYRDTGGITYRDSCHEGELPPDCLGTSWPDPC